MEDKLSIIIPYYNTPKQLTKIVNHLLEQKKKHPQTEIIIIDDGSSYGLPWVCTCDEIIYHHQKNGGASSARNAGLKLATGNYIAFIDSDDRVVDNYLDTLYDLMKDKTWDYVVYHYYFVGRWGYKIQPFHKGALKNYTVWSYLFKRDCIGDEEFDTNMNVAEDADWLARVTKGKKELVLEKTLYYYNFGFNPKSLWHQFKNGTLPKYKDESKAKNW